MTRWLILVKHSLPTLEPGIPAHLWQLSPTGKQRCTGLAQQLSAYLPFRLYSSTEPKATQTAALVASQLHIPWQTHPGLHEHERSQVGFSSPAQFQANMRLFFEHPTQTVFGGESADQAYQRFSTALQVLLDADSPHAQNLMAQNLVVVAHGTVISLYVARRCGLEAYPLWEQLGLPAFIRLDFPIELEQHCQVGDPIDIFNPYYPGAPV